MVTATTECQHCTCTLTFDVEEVKLHSVKIGKEGSKWEMHGIQCPVCGIHLNLYGKRQDDENK